MLVHTNIHTPACWRPWPTEAQLKKAIRWLKEGGGLPSSKCMSGMLLHWSRDCVIAVLSNTWVPLTGMVRNIWCVLGVSCMRMCAFVCNFILHVYYKVCLLNSFVLYVHIYIHAYQYMDLRIFFLFPRHRGQITGYIFIRATYNMQLYKYI